MAFLLSLPFKQSSVQGMTKNADKPQGGEAAQLNPDQALHLPSTMFRFCQLTNMLVEPLTLPRLGLLSIATLDSTRAAV